MKKMIVYGMDENCANKYIEVLRDFDSEFGSVNDTFLNVKMKDIFDQIPNVADTKREFSYIIMDGYTTDDIRMMQKIWKEHDLTFDGVMAMRTPNNENWTLQELVEETTSEHKQMHMISEIATMLQSFTSSQVSAMSQEEKEVLMNAYMMMEKQMFEEKLLTFIYEKCKEIFMKYHMGNEA